MFQLRLVKDVQNIRLVFGGIDSLQELKGLIGELVEARIVPGGKEIGTGGKGVLEEEIPPDDPVAGDTGIGGQVMRIVK